MVGKRADFIERTFGEFAKVLEYASRADKQGLQSGGFIRQLDPRVKWAVCLVLVIAAVSSHQPWVTFALFAFAAVSTVFAGVAGPVFRMVGGVALFSSFLALPSTVMIPGPALARVPAVGWVVTKPGVERAANMILRSAVTTTLMLLMVTTTRWSHLLKSLRMLGVPTVFVVIVGMTQRYIVLLIQLAQTFFEARRVRRVGKIPPSQQRHLAVSSAAALLSKSVQMSEEVYQAMQARGFRGRVYTLDEFRIKPLDWATLAGALALAGGVFWFGRF
jgi:cobalt/nickel transport system permease protein